MIYENLSINTIVCLSCGVKVSVDKLSVVDIKDTDVPNDIKSRGGFFQTLACPKCKKGVYFGFLIDLDEQENMNTTKNVEHKKTKSRKNAIDIVEDDDGIKRTEDGTIIIDDDEVPEEVLEAEQRAEAARRADGAKEVKQSKKPVKKNKPFKPNRIKQNKAQCTMCGEYFQTRDVSLGAFGSRCPKCMRQLKARCG
jgi:predicted Zn-ribbon and HTH transcriptional regulator